MDALVRHGIINENIIMERFNIYCRPLIYVHAVVLQAMRKHLILPQECIPLVTGLPDDVTAMARSMPIRAIHGEARRAPGNL